MNILSLQSQVVYGHVGNSAAVPALQSLGAEVWAVPTALLSNHPGHGRPGGGIESAAETQALLDGLERLGLFARCDGVLSGYLGRAANGHRLLTALDRIRRARPDGLYLCDPVMGDADPGLYVQADLPAFFRDQAAGAADIMTPNCFELEQLTGRVIDTPAAALVAAQTLRRLGPEAVVCTSLELAGGTGIGTLAADGRGAWLVATPKLAEVPQGSGDLLAALLLFHRLRGLELAAALGLAVSAVFAVLKSSAGLPEMALIPHLDTLRAPAEIFPPTPVS